VFQGRCPWLFSPPPSGENCEKCGLRHKITKNGKLWKPHADGRQGGDVWHIPTLAGKRFAKERVAHPTQKPLALSQRLVRHFSNFGELVFVPFVGSGTECVAAIQLGRPYLGAEINPTYVEIAEKRLSKAVSLEHQMPG